MEQNLLDPVHADNPGGSDWVALLPVTLSDGEKRTLQVVDQFGSYIAGALYTTIDPDDLNTLEERELVWSRRERPAGPAIHALTEAGKLWLKRCTKNTGEFVLPDDLTAMFNSLDEQTQRQFAGFAAMQIGMELHPEEVGQAADGAAAGEGE